MKNNNYQDIQVSHLFKENQKERNIQSLETGVFKNNETYFKQLLTQCPCSSLNFLCETKVSNF